MGGWDITFEAGSGCNYTTWYFADNGLDYQVKNAEQWWNDNWQEKTELVREELVSAPLCSPHFPTWAGMGLKPGLRGKRLATNRLINGTARHGCYVDYVDRPWSSNQQPSSYMLTKLQLIFPDFPSAMESHAPGSEIISFRQRSGNGTPMLWHLLISFLKIS